MGEGKWLSDLLAALTSATSIIFQKALGVDYVELGKGVVNKIKINHRNKVKPLKCENAVNYIEEDIKNVISILSKIANTIPIIFILDELDRCVPDYAIKTMERLHHVFGKIKHSVTILSFYREQLVSSIKGMFGQSINENTYLSKFINFSIKLDRGESDLIAINNWLQRYSTLFQEKRMGDFEINSLYDYIPVRDLEHIIRNANICHKLVNKDTSDLPYVCMEAEILLFILKYAGKSEDTPNIIITNYANEPKTNLGKLLRKKIGTGFGQNNSFILSANSDKSIVLYIFNLVLAKGQKWIEHLDGPLIMEKLDDFYLDYKDFFEQIT